MTRQYSSSSIDCVVQQCHLCIIIYNGELWIVGKRNNYLLLLLWGFYSCELLEVRCKLQLLIFQFSYLPFIDPLHIHIDFRMPIPHSVHNITTDTMHLIVHSHVSIINWLHGSNTCWLKRSTTYNYSIKSIRINRKLLDAECDMPIAMIIMCSLCMRNSIIGQIGIILSIVTIYHI